MRPSANNTRRPPFSKYSDMSRTAYGDELSTGNVRLFIITFRRIQCELAVVLEVTNFQSLSRTTPRKSQSSQEA